MRSELTDDEIEFLKERLIARTIESAGKKEKTEAKDEEADKEKDQEKEKE